MSINTTALSGLRQGLGSCLYGTSGDLYDLDGVLDGSGQVVNFSDGLSQQELEWLEQRFGTAAMDFNGDNVVDSRDGSILAAFMKLDQCRVTASGHTIYDLDGTLDGKGSIVDFSDGVSNDELALLEKTFGSFAMDMNGDGKFDLQDGSLLADYMNGSSTVLPRTSGSTVLPETGGSSVIPGTGSGCEDYTEGMANNGMCGMSQTGNIFDNNNDGTIDDLDGDGIAGGEGDIELANKYMEDLAELDALDGNTDGKIDIDALVKNGKLTKNADGSYSATLKDGSKVTFRLKDPSKPLSTTNPWIMTVQDTSGNRMSITNNGDGNIDLSLMDQNGMMEKVTAAYQKLQGEKAKKAAEWALVQSMLLAVMNSKCGDNKKDTDEAKVKVTGDHKIQIQKADGTWGDEMTVDDQTWQVITTANGGNAPATDGSAVITITRGAIT